MKVHELSKEIGHASKEIIEQATTMGIEVKTANSKLPEDKIEAIKEAMAKKGVKAAEKAGKATTKSGSASPVSGRPPMGRPVVSKEVAGRTLPPKGKPMLKAEPIKQEAKPEAGKPADTKPKESAVKATETKAIQNESPVSKVQIIKAAKDNEALAKPNEKVESEKHSVSKDAPKVAQKDAPKVAAKETSKAEGGKKRPEPIKTPMVKSEMSQERQRGPIIVKKADPEADRIEAEKEAAKEERRKERERIAAEKTKVSQEKKAREQSPRRHKPEGTAPKEAVKPADPKAPRKKAKDTKEKDKKDKFNKFEKGAKYQRPTYEAGGMEKKTKGKKQQRVKEIEEPEIVIEELPVGTKVVNVPITVAGFCEQVGVSNSKVIMTLLKLGIVSNINQTLDGDIVQLLAEEIGINVIIGQTSEEIEEVGIEIFEDKEENLKSRPPIITVMGHVDHGKTSLLDAIRTTNVTASESGGITQHIGASEVEIKGKKIVFLDTPGHEAFTAMRARGANVTDIAILVVAADDSVKPQTIESISHAKAAGVPIIVAINKMDKPGANPDTVKKDLTEHGIVVEDWGGDVISVPVSAKTGEGVVDLLEMVLLQADVLELKANPDRLALGTVIEARLDKAKGPVTTLLVTNGTLKTGQSVVAGTCSGKIRLMTNHKGETIRKALPATAVEILGLTDVPAAGDAFNAVKEDRVAKEIAENRKNTQREEVLAKNSSTTLEELFSQIKEGEIKDLNIIVKGDVQGSVGAVITSLEKLTTENVRVRIIHSGVGAVTESDVTLASTSGAIIIGFNVRPNVTVSNMADRENVQIKTYRVIYNIIDDVENAMKGMLDPEFKEVVLGTVQIRETFKVPGAGIIGGAYVTDGKVIRNGEVRLVRDGIVIHEGKISSLRRFKDDAKEVAQGFECGIGLENYNDIKEGDIVECFHMEEIIRD